MAAAPIDLRTPGDGPDAIRGRLLAAAAAVFAERGYDGAGVAEIARRAGVTTGAIYNRFTGKADLLASALDLQAADEFDALFADHRFQGRMEDIIRIAGSHLVVPDPTDCPSLLLEAFVAARRHPDVAELLKQRMDERRDSLAAVIDAAKASGGIDTSLDTGALVAFCHAVGFGFLVFAALDIDVPDVAPWEALITRLVESVAASDRPPTSDRSPTPPSIPAASSPPKGL